MHAKSVGETISVCKSIKYISNLKIRKITYRKFSIERVNFLNRTIESAHRK